MINVKFQIINLNENDKNTIELLNQNNDQYKLEIKSQSLILKDDNAEDQPFLVSNMNCSIEVKYTNKNGRNQCLCRNTKRYFNVKFLQILKLTKLIIKDVK